MTTVAWDGTTLAADRRCTIDGVRSSFSKVRRGRSGNLVGAAGPAALVEAVLDWLCDGAPRPESQSDPADFCDVLEIGPDGACYRHERLGRIRLLDAFAAIGSGKDFAVTAMHLGRDAAEAVEIASLFDTATGDGVEALRLEPVAPRRLRAAAAPATRQRRTAP